MDNNSVKKEFSKVILNAKIVATIFFILLTPNIVMIFKDKTEMFGLPKDTWFNLSIVGFLLYIAFVLFLWKCPKCKQYPGRGWFRKNCDKCGVELT